MRDNLADTLDTPTSRENVVVSGDFPVCHALT